jgi:hypothetical protein
VAEQLVASRVVLSSTERVSWLVCLLVSLYYCHTEPASELTVSIAKRRPGGRTREGSCSDGTAVGVLELLVLTAADHTTTIAPAYGPRW